MKFTPERYPLTYSKLGTMTRQHFLMVDPRLLYY